MKTKLSPVLPYPMWYGWRSLWWRPSSWHGDTAFSSGTAASRWIILYRWAGTPDVFRRSFKLALIATAICLLIGYPVSYLDEPGG